MLNSNVQQAAAAGDVAHDGSDRSGDNQTWCAASKKMPEGCEKDASPLLALYASRSEL